MRWIFVYLIKFYKKFISPMFPARCKYYPTCSSYALEAYRKHGFIKGTILSVWRILRCNPWSNGGVDHVPEEFNLFKSKKRK
ncbi:MAG: membrane protein insertion efficiency factor YidD [Oscillospiraceae bacterium]